MYSYVKVVLKKFVEQSLSNDIMFHFNKMLYELVYHLPNYH